MKEKNKNKKRVGVSILIILPVIYGYFSLVLHQNSKSGNLQRLAAMPISDSEHS